MTDSRRDELAANLAAVQTRIDDACRAAGRDPSEVTLVVVTKFFPGDDVVELAGLGVEHVGENRDQEAGPKVAELDEQVRSRLTVHFIGQLQTNKANHVTRYADVVQSVDRAKLVRALDRGVGNALEEGARHTPLAVTLQVDLGQGEDRGRGGAAPEEVPALADAVAAAEHLQLRGLMAVAPLGLDDDGTRAAFERLARLGEDLRREHPEATWLSAGMSGDLETAVTCGATHLRVGTAIMGSRL
ncbi:YggS family pyridoxal phosphate-dependent enzyme [Ornithinimicrobium pekingense]|uniref:Pyridoxal phosphate homeostasis protein n=1 Tax=Ornithinimicrobium pekingense TaxID=384677 RepID=A0ABQ2F8D6_9MICO|nr:YggS family pyridoxal phosphate-dependent enzyme [Ornithinimicrobium pekingense]GGK68733.1 YggS family pyridoxal phosphate enzyme [Ornithinimicrobium pekingense]